MLHNFTFFASQKYPLYKTTEKSTTLSGSLCVSSLYSLYLSLQIILPFVRSYGDISIVTLSPGRMRIKFILSFPLICARIWCPFSNSTWNMAFGNFSTTFPSTSITSAFDILFPPETSLFLIKLNRSFYFLIPKILLRKDFCNLFRKIFDNLNMFPVLFFWLF